MEKYQKFIIGLVWAIIIVLFISYFGNIFVWILLSAFIATIGSPFMKLLKKMRIIPKWLASILTLGIISFVIVFAFSILVPLIADQVSKFQAIDIETVSDALEKPIKEIDDFISTSPIFDQPEFSIEDFVLDKIHSIISFNSVGKVLNSVGGTAWNFLLSTFSIFFISFFLLKDKESIAKATLVMVPKSFEKEVITIYKSIKNLISRYLFGVMLEVLCMMTLFTTGLYIIGVNFSLSLLVGIIAGMLNIIPYLGPWIGAGIGVLLISIGNLDMDFYNEILPLNIKVLVVVAIAQIIDNILFQPLIYSKSIKAHPVEIYLVIIIAGSIYGVIGMMLAIPAYTVLRVLAKEIIYLNKKTSDENIVELEEIKNENI